MLPERFTEYAYIRSVSQQNPLFEDERILSFFWDGPPNAPVRLGWDFRDIVNHPNFPFKLKKIHYDVLTGETLYLRTDIFINIKVIQLLEWRWLQHCKAFNDFQMRIIMTLHIWGLAYVEVGAEPSWACLGRRNPYGRR